MANDCYNDITIIGTIADIEAIRTLITREDGTIGIADGLMPMPAVLQGTVSGSRTEDDQKRSEAALAATGHDDWYSWQHANWGIEWGDRWTEIVDSDGVSIRLKCSTPWGPFGDVFWQHVTAEHEVKVIVSYDEPNMEFMGVTGYWSGETVFDEHMDYPEVADWPEGDDDAMWQAIQDRDVEAMRMLDDASDRCWAEMVPAEV